MTYDVFGGTLNLAQLNAKPIYNQAIMNKLGTWGTPASAGKPDPTRYIIHGLRKELKFTGRVG